ncbi:hypothetical protein HDV06_004012 [Boothiomyces sp. JEL0866]|nr:hypothetical protein HDV06_004012 [Boothiomyces sp. JEL0866]
MNNLSSADMQLLEAHSMIRENQEMQKMLLGILNNCFNQCSTDFSTGKMTDKERKCISNCSQKYWAYFERAQGKSQEFMQQQQ